MNLDALVMTPRVARLRERMLSEPRFASIEQARIITDAYRSTEGMPRMLRRATALVAAMEKLEICVDPEERIVGNRTRGVRAGVVFPESGSAWVDREFETLPSRPQDTFEVRKEDVRAFREDIYPYWKGKSLEDVLRARCGEALDALAPVVKINQKDHAQGHICPNVEIWLRVGPAGLCARAKELGKAAEGERADFYRAVAMVTDGACAFLRRYADLLEAEARDACGDTRENMLECANVCTALAARPAQSFHEAVQSVWMLFVLLQMESNASSFSPGRLDAILWPYYLRDIRSGALTRQAALELIECLFLKFNSIVYMRNANSARYFAGFPIGFNIALGGQGADGSDFVNELSFLFLRAQAHLGLPQPNLSVRLHRGTGDALLEEAVRVVARGSGMPQFFNDEAIIPALEGVGVREEDARGYAIVGCVELSPSGCCLGWSDAAMFNLNKVLELTLNGGRCLLTGRQLGPDTGTLPDYADFAAFEAAFARQIDYFMDAMLPLLEQVERAHQELLPTPLLSCVVDDCLARGVDVTRGGARYNLSGIQMIQVANLADSLAAIKQLVYEQRAVEPARLLKALRSDFAGEEALRQRLLHRAGKYGNDLEEVDALANRWAFYFRARLERHRNYRGGAYHTGLYTVSAHVPMGQNVGATPDGRHAREPLADGGMSPVYGRDVNGPTAVLRSVSRVESRLASNGGLLNMKFLPSFFASEAGVHKFGLFLRAFVDLRIPHVQFNVVRPEDLRAAQREPEKYRSLTVRVAGYTAYFVELAEDLQNEIIARTSYAGV